MLTSEHPTITVVEYGSIYIVLVLHPSQPDYNKPVPTPGVLSTTVTLSQALDEAYSFLYRYDNTAGTNFSLSQLNYAFAADTVPQQQLAIAISDEAWSYLSQQTRLYGYEGRAAHLGISVYLRSLVSLNPTPAHWTDNRPNDPLGHELHLYDAERAAQGQLPLWSHAIMTETTYRASTPNPVKLDRYGRPGPTRKPYYRYARSFNPDHIQAILPILQAVADRFLITPYSYKGGDVLNIRLRAYAVIEAIGLQLLTPRNPPIYNSRPARPPRLNRRRTTETYRNNQRGGALNY